MRAVEHQASPQRNTNWVLMRSTASVSEEPIQFFYILVPELLSPALSRYTHQLKLQPGMNCFFSFLL